MFQYACFHKLKFHNVAYITIMDQDQSEVTINSTVLFTKSPVRRITGVANQRQQSVVAHFIPQQSNPTQKIKAAPCL